MMEKWTGDRRTWRAAAAVLAVLALGAAAALVCGLLSPLHENGKPVRHSWAPDELSMRGGALAEKTAWALFQGGEVHEAATPKGALAARYRLAGVFMVFDAEGHRDDSQARCAILDDVQTGEQLLAAESEQVGDVRVVRIENEYVLLSDGAHEEMVFLAPPATGGGRSGDATGLGGQQLAGAAPTVLETNRFGARVGETRWEISKDVLMKYAQEVLDDPQRVSGMYLGMAPDYDEQHSVAGYRLDTSCGEADFYAQIGFQNGDVVRRVNSLRMTSQRRAEFLLSQFFDGQLDTFVFDIERNGEPLKLIYMLR